MVATAIPAGFAAGLFGIGGGLITVPILFYIFSTSGIDPNYLMHLAVGTSFGIIIPTSIVSVICLLYTSPSPRDQRGSRMPSSA